MNIQGWFSLEFTGLISLLTKGLSRVLSSTKIWKHQFFGVQLVYDPLLTSIHDYWKKTIALTRWTFVSKVMSLLLNMLSRFFIALLPSKHLWISWLQSPSAVIVEPKKIKSLIVSSVSPSICHEVMGQDAMISVFSTLSFKPGFLSLLSPSSRGRLHPLHFMLLEWYHPHIWGCQYFSIHSWFQLGIHPAQHFALCTLNIS